MSINLKRRIFSLSRLVKLYWSVWSFYRFFRDNWNSSNGCINRHFGFIIQMFCYSKTKKVWNQIPYFKLGILIFWFGFWMIAGKMRWTHYDIKVSYRLSIFDAIDIPPLVHTTMPRWKNSNCFITFWMISFVKCETEWIPNGSVWFQ